MKRMKIALLGATGETGGLVLKEALRRGHLVRAGVRDPSKLSDLQHPNLSVVTTDVFSVESLEQLFQGQGAVVSALGFPKAEKVTGFSDTMPLIVTAMRAAKVRRLVAISAWFTDSASRDRGFYQNNWKFVPGLASVLDDQCRMEDFLEKEAGDLLWSAVKPGTLSWGPSLGHKLHYKIGESQLDTASYIIRRSDLAVSLLEVLASEARGKVAVGVVCTQTEEEEELRQFQSHMTTQMERTFGKDKAPDMSKLYIQWAELVAKKHATD